MIGLENLEGYGKQWIIEWTNDYELFKTTIYNNNNPRSDNLEKIRKSILENGYFDYSVIIIDYEGELIDGQHRIWALRRIKEETGKIFEVPYIRWKKLIRPLKQKEINELRNLIQAQKKNNEDRTAHRITQEAKNR